MDLQASCEDLARRARQASRRLATAPGAAKNRWLHLAADALEKVVADQHWPLPSYRQMMFVK